LQWWIGQALGYLGDPARWMEHCAEIVAVIGDREPSQLLVDCLAQQSVALTQLGRIPEAYECAHRSLAVARELGYPLGEVCALMYLVIAASSVGDWDAALRFARRAEQVQGIPGLAVRTRSHMLVWALIETGDLAAAEQVCFATLASARALGDMPTIAALLTPLVVLDLWGGRPADAATHLREATQLILRSGDRFEMVNVLDNCGHLCVATQRFADAITAWSALDSVCQQLGQALSTNALVPETLRRIDALGKARRALAPGRVRQAEERGAAMGPITAAEYILMLTAPNPPPPGGQAMPGNLSARERELVTLVAQGRTDAEIAAQLYISIRTVRSHLDRIRDKSGCRRRADLTRFALSAGLL
jgi:DNA-binding CsgD family transcriptional regulator